MRVKHCFLNLLLFCFCLHLLVSTAMAASYGSLKAIRIGAQDKVSRMVLETSQDIPYHIFNLTSPDRLVIDLPEMEWTGMDLKKSLKSSVDQGVIEGYRVGLFKPGITRVVIDLASPVKIKSLFKLEPNAQNANRLVMDLEKDGARPLVAKSKDWDKYEASLNVETLSAPKLSIVPIEKKRPIIIIDPGHGGIDPGAISISGNYEKHIVLAAAKLIAKKINDTGRYDVVLTRDRDIFIPLRRRYEVAHKANADLFISLHADSHSQPNFRGISLYTLSEKASDSEAAALAAKENKSDVIAGTNLGDYTAEVSSILIDLAQQSVNQSSWYFAEMVVETVKPSLKMIPSPHRFAGFAVLKSPNVPSILIELGYLSNKKDEENLKDDNYLNLLADKLLAAMDKYFERQSRLNEGL